VMACIAIWDAQPAILARPQLAIFDPFIIALFHQYTSTI
jgi:hypothetical protein